MELQHPYQTAKLPQCMVFRCLLSAGAYVRSSAFFIKHLLEALRQVSEFKGLPENGNTDTKSINSPTAQRNTYCHSWKDFFTENRLRFIKEACIEIHGSESQLTSLIDKTIENVVPKLLDDNRLGGQAGIKPVLVHGDLWSGNSCTARIGGRGGMEEVIYDPSACYAQSE